MYVSSLNIFLLIIYVFYIVADNVVQELFKNTYPSFLATKLTIKTKLKEI